MRRLGIVLLLCLMAVPAYGERFVFWEYPGIPIPADDSLGVWDSLYIDENIIIEDLNVYIGIDTGGWADLLANPVPPEPNGYEFDRSEFEADDNSANGNDFTLRRWDRRFSLGITEFLDKNLGGVYLGSSLNTGWRNRSRKNKAPGYYMDSPGNPAFPPDDLSDSQEKNIDKGLTEILTPQYYWAQVCEYAQEYENVLRDSTRIEFYGRVTINGKKFALGGWFGRLTAVGVFDDDDSYHDVKGFLARAREYFLLPPISADDLKVATSDDDFFYSYLDRDKGLMLRGYRVSLDSPDEGQPSIRAKVIEYIKYYDPEFVP